MFQNVLFSPCRPCQSVSQSDIWRRRKWGIENPHEFAKSEQTPPWKLVPPLMASRLDGEYVINERDYKQPSLNGLWFDTARFFFPPLHRALPLCFLHLFLPFLISGLCLFTLDVFSSYTESLRAVIWVFSDADIECLEKQRGPNKNNPACGHTHTHFCKRRQARWANNASTPS